ncbi:MAG: hypothetical protein M3022_13070 [Actinomycetota bacterium]|nr:hypothetical protein [Actinomycetota bacterium]
MPPFSSQAWRSALGGCGAIGTIAKEIGVAACQQAASGQQNSAATNGTAGMPDRRERQHQPSDKAAKQVAHEGCVLEAAKIIDPIARGQIQALCPTIK